MANKVIPTATGIYAERTYVQFDTGEANPLFLPTQIQLGCGQNPNTAHVDIRVMDIANSTNGVALRKTIANQFKHGTRAIVGRLSSNGNKVPLMAGSITGVQHTLADGVDSLNIEIKDDRIFLKEFRIIGRMGFRLESAGSGEGVSVFQSGFASHFNRGGRADKIQSSDMGNWVFAPYPDYGWTSSTSLAGNVDNKKIATYWTKADILTYVIDWWINYASTIRAKHPWFPVFPSNISVDSSFATILDAEVGTNQGQTTDQQNSSIGEGRKGRELNINGLSFLDLLDILMQGTGYTYTLKIVSAGSSECQLVPVPTRFIENGAKDVSFASSYTTLESAVPNEIHFGENSEGTTSNKVLVGAPVEMEQRLSTASQTSGGGTIDE